MKILITPKSFKNYKEKTYPLLTDAGYGVIENPAGRTLTEDEIIGLAQADVVGIIVGIDPLTARVLESCRHLRAIAKYGVGTDNIDLAAAKRLGISVRIAAGSNNVSVAELTIALMFEAARRISAMGTAVRRGGWERVLGMELTGKTLGLIGGGQIGKEVAKRARGLSLNVLIHDPYYNDPDFLGQYGVQLCRDLNELLAAADIVSLHLPLNDETRHLINARTISRMKKAAILINTSRGELVDEESLYAALEARAIAFAAEDVFSQEPPPAGAKLLALDNFLLLPHAGAYTAEAIERMALYSTNNLLAMLDGAADRRDS